MTWDVTTPAGSESAAQGDDRIRELKSDLQNSLRGEQAEGVEAIFPGSDTANPVYRPRFRKDTTGARPAAGQFGLFINDTTKTIDRDNGASWEAVATLIPPTTVACFFQAAAPVGWTKLVTQNDRVLRVVSGAGGGSGGTIATSTSLAHSHTVNGHTHDYSGTTSQGSSGNLAQTGGQLQHAFTTHTHTFSGTTTGASNNGTDSQLAGALAYADVIICSKD
jgi:hypothetical protein